MSYNQKPSGSSGSGGAGGNAPNGPNNQTQQQVAKTLAGIQQQMQSLVHGQNALPQAQAADINAFFQQQRFQNMFKQQQHQLLQQHFQQQMQHQQQSKDRAAGGEPLALTRTPAAAELLNKTYQQHHQQQANGSSANANSALSVNQQFQQQLQAFPPNIVQQLQALQALQQQQQQQQPHPSQQHHPQQLQQAHQQQQHQPVQHQAPQQTLHAGQIYQQQQQQQKALSTAAAAHMQQLQQSLQQKYLSAAAAASQPAAASPKISATPPPLTNQLKPPNLPPSTQITPVPAPVTLAVTASTSSGVTKSASTTALISAASGITKTISPPSQSSSHTTAKQPAISPTANIANQHSNKLVAATAVANKTPPIVSAIPPPFPTHYQKPSSGATAAVAAVASLAGGSGVGAISTSSPSTSSSNKNTVNPDIAASKTPQTSAAALLKQTVPVSSTAVTKPVASTVTSAAAVTVATNINPLSTQKSTPVAPVLAIVQTKPHQATDTSNKTSGASPTSTTAAKPEDALQVKPLKTAEPAISASAPVKIAAVSSSETIKQNTENAVKDPIPFDSIGTNKANKGVTLNQVKMPETSKTPDSTETATGSNKTSEVTSATIVTKVNTTLNEIKEDISIKSAAKSKVDNSLGQISAAKKDITSTVDLNKEVLEKTSVKNVSLKDESSEISRTSAGKKNISAAEDKTLDSKEKPLESEDAKTQLESELKDEKSQQLEEKKKEEKTAPKTVETAKNTITTKSDGKVAASKEPIKDLSSKVEIQNATEKSIDNDNITEKPKGKNENIKAVNVTEETAEKKSRNVKPESVDVKNTSKDLLSNKTKADENLDITEIPVKKIGRQPKVVKTPSADKNEGSAKRVSRDDRRSSAKQQKLENPTDTTPSTPNEPKKSSSSDRKSQRHRLKTILYQSPLPELAYITKLSASEASNSPKPMSIEDKLIVFYKNEYMAVRNAEGTFYLCQTMQNVYRTSPRISIRWLSEDKKESSVYIPDFYDHTDIECVLTTVELKRVDKGHLRLPNTERARIESILKKAIDVEKGLLPRPDITEENPDGLDISLYKDESQIEKKTSGGLSPSTSGRKSRRSSYAAKSSLTPSTRKRKSTGAGSKSQTKKRKTAAKKKKTPKKHSSDDDSSEDEEESDTDYKPNQKKGTNPSSKSSPRAQRSPLARARAASPITQTSSKAKDEVPQTSTSTPISNSRSNRANKRKSSSELEAPFEAVATSVKKNTSKATTLKSKAQDAEATITKSSELNPKNSENTPSTSSAISRSTRNRK